MNPLLMAFTATISQGSADAMEALTINGVRTALFLGHPTEERLQEKLQSLQAVGISGTSRTMTPAQMDDELPAQLASERPRPRLIHYKVCATFDFTRSAASAMQPTLPSMSSNRRAASSSRAYHCSAAISLSATISPSTVTRGTAWTAIR